MTQFELIPKRSNTTARSTVIVCMVGAFALMLLTVALGTLPYRWVLQLIAIGLLTAGIFLTTRYQTKLYIYRIVSTESGWDLTVTEAAANGKRQVTVCRVGLRGIRERILLEQTKPTETEAALKPLREAKQKIYDYCVDLKPEKSILLLVEECGQELALRLSYDDALWSYLAPAERTDADEE